jgi:hypothetical protein
VIVTGGRDFTDHELMDRALSSYEPLIIVVHGNADGADKMAAEWAKNHNVLPIPYPCTPEMWTLMSRNAGNVRNRQMLLAFPNVTVVAFPGPKSRGTWNCMRDAVSMNMQVDLWSSEGCVTGWKP